MTARLLDEQPHGARVKVDEIRATLDLIARGLPPVLADDRLRTVRAQIEIFGLHAARLDIREESATLARALGGMLRVLGIDRNFVRSDQRARTERLVRVLSDAPPKAADLAAAAAAEGSGEPARLFPPTATPPTPST